MRGRVEPIFHGARGQCLSFSNIWVCYGWLKARSYGWEWEGGTNTISCHAYVLVAYSVFKNQNDCALVLLYVESKASHGAYGSPIRSHT